MREFFRACELEPEMLEQAALTAAFLSAKERWAFVLSAHTKRAVMSGNAIHLSGVI
jgi:hypothetical protein